MNAIQVADYIKRLLDRIHPDNSIWRIQNIILVATSNNENDPHTKITVRKHDGLRTFDVIVEDRHSLLERIMLVGEDGNGGIILLKEKTRFE